MKIVLFHTSIFSFVSVLISIFTLNKYSHSAIVCEGAVYDAVQRGFCCSGRINNLYSKRKITVLSVNDIDTDLLYKEICKIEKLSITYDESTVIRYIKNDKKENKLYCFEAVCLLLSKVGYNVNTESRLTSNDIMRIIAQKEYNVEFVGYPSDYIEKEV